jgi:hypothetical protein
MALHVIEAEATVLMLQRKRAALVSKGRELADERVSVSIQTQIESGAHQRLREINSALAVIEAEMRNINCALEEARKRLTLAQAQQGEAA